MNETTNSKIEYFISWVHENAARLLTEAADVVADQLGDALLHLNSQLGVEVAEDSEKDAREVIITAFSDPNLFYIVYLVVELLQDIPGWNFVALKQPRGFAFKLIVGGYQLDAKTLKFTPIPDISGGFQLIVSPQMLRALPTGQEAEEFAWLIVETGIGEELAGRLQHLEFVSSEEVRNGHSITEMEAYITEIPKLVEPS
jgi:hypothetical protein